MLHLPLQCEEQNVDVDYQGGENEWTALHWAADRGNAEMVISL